MALVLDKCFLFRFLASFFKHLLSLNIRMESCDLWLRQIQQPLIDTMRNWLVYPNEKSLQRLIEISPSQCCESSELGIFFVENAVQQ